MNIQLNKHLEKITYLIIGAVFTTAYLNKSALLFTLAMYAFSGASTNSLAIIMIFDKIPGVIGSGIIEKNFHIFQVKLKQVLMEHFFKNGLNFDSLDTQKIGERLYQQISDSDYSILTQFMSQEKVVKLIDAINITEILNNSLDSEQIEVYLESQIMEMSPQEIKTLILHIMHEHLQFLVVWGAIFGALMGYVAYCII